MEIINNRPGTNFEFYINEALNRCDFHFTGGFTESMGEICPCDCLCKNCEMIPKSEILIRMQELGKDLTDEDVFFYYLKEISEKKGIRKSSKTHDTNHVLSDGRCE